MSELPVDTLVRERYRILRVIANGGMGVLYEAFDQQFERTVALKQNNPDVLQSQFFLSEARILGKLRHPNLPAAIDVFEDGDQQFFVMEFIDGKNLDQLLSEQHQLSVNTITPWVLQILAALGYLHSHQPPIIHRDIKPSNLIVAQDMIFLVDFGISKDDNQTRLAGSGTLPYAPPEQFYGVTVPASDLYSLAATVYHLLTGVPPANAMLRVQEVRKGHNDPLIAAHLSGYGAEIDPAVSAILSRALKIDPQERYQSAAEMRAAFEHTSKTAQQLEAPLVPIPQVSWRQRVQEQLAQRIQEQPPWLRWGMAGALIALLVVLCGLLLLPPPLVPPDNASRGTRLAVLSSPTASASPTATFAPLAPTVALASRTPTAVATPSPTSAPPPDTPTSAPSLAPPTPLPAAPNTIRIALQSPTTGEWGALGTGILNGATLASEQQRKPLTDLGYNVELLAYDDRSSPDQGRANAQTIVADPAVLCLVGHFNSGVTLAAQPLYEAANLVQISPGSTNPQVTDSNDNVWRVVGRDDVQGRVASTFARETLKSQRAYIIHDDTTYGRGIATVFQQDAQANGPGVVGFSAYDDNQSEIDWTRFLEEVQQTGPDVIYFAGSYNRAAPFFKQLRERGYTGQFLGSDSLDNAELGSVAGEAVNGMHFTTVAAPISAFPQAAQFAQSYQERYGQAAPPFSPESYDATAICIQAVARAARATGQFPAREQVLAAMRELPRYQGISGNYAFNANGDPQSVAYFVVQVNAQNWSANRVVQELFVRP